MKPKILIVDDEQNIREIIKDLLQIRGYKVTTAVDGKDALDKMKSFLSIRLILHRFSR